MLYINGVIWQIRCYIAVTQDSRCDGRLTSAWTPVTPLRQSAKPKPITVTRALQERSCPSAMTSSLYLDKESTCRILKYKICITKTIDKQVTLQVPFISKLSVHSNRWILVGVDSATAANTENYPVSRHLRFQNIAYRLAEQPVQIASWNSRKFPRMPTEILS